MVELAPVYERGFLCFRCADDDRGPSGPRHQEIFRAAIVINHVECVLKETHADGPSLVSPVIPPPANAARMASVLLLPSPSLYGERTSLGGRGEGGGWRVEGGAIYNVDMSSFCYLSLLETSFANSCLGVDGWSVKITSMRILILVKPFRFDRQIIMVTSDCFFMRYHMAMILRMILGKI